MLLQGIDPRLESGTGAERMLVVETVVILFCYRCWVPLLDFFRLNLNASVGCTLPG